MAAKVSPVSRTVYKRKCMPESCPSFGEDSEAVLRLKRLRLEESEIDSTSTPFSPTQHHVSSSQPVTPTSSPSAPAGFPCRGQPSMSPQQKLPTIPEVHPELDEIHLAGQQAPSNTQSQNCPTTPGQPFKLLASHCGQQAARQWTCQDPVYIYTAQAGTLQPVSRGVDGLSSSQAVAREQDDSMEEEQGRLWEDSPGSRPFSANDIPLAAQLQGVRDGGHRLLIPEHLTALPPGIADLGGGSAQGISGSTAGDNMAVVPYVPPKAVFEEAYRRMLFQQHLPSSLESWNRRSGLKFDNEHSLQDVGSPRLLEQRRGVVIQELEAETDSPTAMEE